MATNQGITTSLIDRRVKLGWNNQQAMVWAEQHPGEQLDEKVVPAKYKHLGQCEGMIRAVFKDAGRMVYVVECQGELMELSTENFDILPKE